MLTIHSPSDLGNSSSDNSVFTADEPKEHDTAWNPFSALPDSDDMFWKKESLYSTQSIDSTSKILESLQQLRLDTAQARARGLVLPAKRKEEEKNKGKNVTLFKTEMCTSFNASGQCRYGSKCKFAHGPNEIRRIARHPKYKTQLCRSFFEGRECPYGKRCCYLHHTPSDYIGFAIPELSPMIPEPIKQLPILTYSAKDPPFLPFQSVNLNYRS